MGRWNNLAPLDTDYIVSNYGKKTVHQIATELNATTDRVRKVLKMNGVKLLGKSALYESVSQYKFDYEDELCDDYKNGLTLTECCKKYKCGAERVRLILDRNNIDRKKGKGGRMVEVWANGKRKPRNCNKGGTKDVHNALFNRWKANAKSRNYPFEISIEYVQSIIEKQGYKCALTGMDLKCPRTYNEKKEMTSSPYLVSLDRIDSNIGYVEGNVQAVCVWANKAKGSYDNDVFLAILTKFKNV